MAAGLSRSECMTTGTVLLVALVWSDSPGSRTIDEPVVGVPSSEVPRPGGVRGARAPCVFYDGYLTMRCCYFFFLSSCSFATSYHSLLSVSLSVLSLHARGPCSPELLLPAPSPALLRDRVQHSELSALPFPLREVMTRCPFHPDFHRDLLPQLPALHQGLRSHCLLRPLHREVYLQKHSIDISKPYD